MHVKLFPETKFNQLIFLFSVYRNCVYGFALFSPTAFHENYQFC